VAVLVATILSQNTSAANSSAGFRRLRERFATWDDLADARVRAIERCIRVSVVLPDWGRFDGVGPKTALCVLMFALGMPVFPVDTHIFRITRRLGLLPDGISPQRAHEILTPLIAPGDRYEMHLLLIAHGRRICLARDPKCSRCPLLSLCEFAERVAPGAKARS